MGALVKEDWAFDRLLKGVSVRELRIIRLYEYAREVTLWTANTITLGQMAMLLSHPHLVTPLFGFCVTKPGCTNKWLRIPYFKLSRSIREELLKLYDVHLVALIDPSDPLHGMPFVPVGLGELGTSRERIKLDLPLESSNEFRRECIDALLAQRFPEPEHPANEGGAVLTRRLKTDLKYLGALRLLRYMTTADKALRYSHRKSGQALYATASGWSRAKSEATKIIESFENELRPVKELFASAPRDITSVQYDSGTGRLDYSIEAP